MKTTLVLASLALVAVAVAPEVDSWMLNCDGTTGYNGAEVNVQEVEYTDDDVFVHSTGIPSHPIGPWNANPNDADDRQHVFQIPRNLNTSVVSAFGRTVCPVRTVSRYSTTEF